MNEKMSNAVLPPTQSWPPPTNAKGLPDENWRTDLNDIFTQLANNADESADAYRKDGYDRAYESARSRSEAWRSAAFFVRTYKTLTSSAANTVAAQSPAPTTTIDSSFGSETK